MKNLKSEGYSESKLYRVQFTIIPSMASYTRQRIQKYSAEKREPTILFRFLVVVMGGGEGVRIFFLNVTSLYQFDSKTLN